MKMKILFIDFATMPPYPYFSDAYPSNNDGMWVKIKLDSPFMYDPAKSLVVSGDIRAAYGEGSVVGVMGVLRATVDSAPHGIPGTQILKHFYSHLLIRDSVTGKTTGRNVEKVYLDFGFDIEPLGVEEVQGGFYQGIYPNPAREVLYVEGVKQVGRYEIYDLTGRQLIRHTSASNAIAVDALPPGIYLLQFVKDKTACKIRFVKE